MSALALGLKLSAIKTLSAVQRAINILKSAGPGAWYDPSDMANYTTPVGPELVTNGTFESDSSWNKEAGWSISGGKAVATATSGAVYQGPFSGTGVGTEIGKWYVVEFDATITSGSVKFRSSSYFYDMSISGRYRVTFKADSQNVHVYGTAFTGTVDNISVKELTGLSACTMFQDSAGTTPVTAVEQPVGLMLDKSKGLVLGAELVTTSGATLTGTTGFTSVTGSACTATKSYAWEYTCTLTSGTVQGVIGGTLLSSTSTSGTYRGVVVATSSTAPQFYSAAGVGSVSGFTVRELPGAHLIQPTATSRPILSARKNWLLGTEVLSTQNVTTKAASHVLSFYGTGTVTLSGTSTAGPLVGTGVSDRVSLTFTPTAGTLTLTVSGSVTRAQLEYAI